jgi:iron(III) transport system permease protein
MAQGVKSLGIRSRLGTGRLRGRLTDPWWLTALVLLVVMGFLVLYPQLWIVRTSLLLPEGQGVTVSNYVRFFSEARFRDALLNSLSTSVLATLGAAMVAVPLAFLLARYRLRGKSALLTLITAALVAPPFLGAYAWILLLGRSGMISPLLRSLGIPWRSIIGPGGVVWTMVWFLYPLLFLLVYDAFVHQDPSLEEAALAAGASPLRATLSVSLPMVTPALATGGYLALAAAFADFGTPRLIGADFTTLAVLIYFEFLSEVRTNPAMASASSVIMIAASAAFLLLQRYLVSRRSYATVSARTMPERPLSAVGQVVLWLYAGTILLLSFAPHLIVLLSSFLTWRAGLLGWRFTLSNYQTLLSRSLSPIVISYFLSIVSTVIVVIVGLLVAYILVRKGYALLAPALNALVTIPYIIAGTVLALGMIGVFNRPPLVLTGTWIILCLSYIIRRLSYSMRAVESALYQVHPSLEEAAMSVGASSMRTFVDITTPLIMPSVVSGGTMSFLTIITELSSTIMLYAAPWITMTIVILVNAVGGGETIGIASAMTVVLQISILVPLYLISRVGRARASAF